MILFYRRHKDTLDPEWHFHSGRTPISCKCILQLRNQRAALRKLREPRSRDVSIQKTLRCLATRTGPGDITPVGVRVHALHACNDRRMTE